MKRTLLLLFLGMALPVWGQTNIILSNSDKPGLVADKNVLSIQTNLDLSDGQRVEQVRSDCILGRRFCGKILQVLPGGLVVESGYTNLLREPLTSSWLVPGTVTASRAANLMQANVPGAEYVGTVYLTDLPKRRNFQPKKYDYVIIEGYPAGQFTYTSLGTIYKTVRHFSAQLSEAVALNLQTKPKMTAAAVK